MPAPTDLKQRLQGNTQQTQQTQHSGKTLSNTQQNSATLSNTQQGNQQTESISYFNLSGEIREYIGDSTGSFTTQDIDREFNLRTRAEKNLRARVLSDLLYKEKKILKDRTIRGRYHVLDNSLQFISQDDQDQEEFGLSLPLGLESMVSIPPKAIIVVAGTSNAGKTALLLSIAAMNLDRHAGRIMYLMSEMGSGEFKRRLRCFDGVPYEKWFSCMRSAERSTGFLSAIKGGNPDGITLIDFLEEVNGEYFKIASSLREIYDALGSGVAVVALQKGSNTVFGRGGETTAEKPRLYLTLDKMVELDRGVVSACRVVKAKDYQGPNPNGKEIHCRITGEGISTLNDWARMDVKERESLALQYKAGLSARRS